MTTQVQYEQLKAQGYNLIPVYRQRLADTETPLSVFARLKDHQQAYLFESVEGGENWARYSIIGLGESTVFSCNAGKLTIQHVDGTYEQKDCADPFEYMKKFSGRIPMIHFKDMKSDLSLSYPESLAEIGTGCIDFLPFLKWGEKNGIESYIVEQDVSALSGGMLESMAVSLENLIKLSEQLWLLHQNFHFQRKIHFLHLL